MMQMIVFYWLCSMNDFYPRFSCLIFLVAFFKFLCLTVFCMGQFDSNSC